ncbi:MAG: hypothetical protein DWH80_00135 [Planctomycetota bacterium]|nr:MAG: hypothetical protein DWH80_00135 [Planctomycetota bacterium]
MPTTVSCRNGCDRILSGVWLNCVTLFLIFWLCQTVNVRAAEDLPQRDFDPGNSLFSVASKAVSPSAVLPFQIESWTVPLPPVDNDPTRLESLNDIRLCEFDFLEELPAPFEPVENQSHPGRGPPILKDSFENIYDLSGERPIAEPLFRYFAYPPAGFTGSSSVVPSESQESAHFVPMEDRWRIGVPIWDRYGRDHPRLDDYPQAPGNIFNPYTQNLLKEDFPLIGQNSFFNLNVASRTIANFRQVPTPTTPFESTPTPGEEDFFGNPNGFFFLQFYTLAFELNHGDKTFKPNDWRIKVAPVINTNYLEVYELGVVSPDVAAGTRRSRGFATLEEWFLEAKLADLSPDYDFMSVRAGSQPFTSDFRGFIFSDLNRAVRLFGTRLSNRDQFNLILFDQREKDTNSFLNSFDPRGQTIFIANYFRQDFIWPGHTVQASFHFDNDQASLKYDKNGNLVRPDPVGLATPHEVNAAYFGLATDGHINELNITSAMYYVTGHDTLNPQALQPVNISAYSGALELSYSPDWIRYRASAFYASGDNNINDNIATGFDAIIDNPQFAGGEFSFWQRQSIKLLGTNLKNFNSLLPDLRASNKFQSQANFLNPGIRLFNLGMDFELTQRTRLISNCNFLYFDTTAVLQSFVFQDNIPTSIGTDLSLGVESRPLLNNNWIFRAGISGLLPGDGFQALYGPITGQVPNLFAAFTDLELAF